MVKRFACYDYNASCFLVEMTVAVPPAELALDDFCMPDPTLAEDAWQVPYQEQYLNADGTERICELFEVPESDVPFCRVAFFIYKTALENPMLSTPYGTFPLTATEPLPERLRAIVEFDEEDPQEDLSVTVKNAILYGPGKAADPKPYRIGATVCSCVAVALLVTFTLAKRLSPGFASGAETLITIVIMGLLCAAVLLGLRTREWPLFVRMIARYVVLCFLLVSLIFIVLWVLPQI